MDYRDLKFYQRARQVLIGVDREIKTWSRGVQSDVIARQLFRAASSIGANIAEGHGRHHGKEYVHYLLIARGSANEVDHWLHSALDSGVGRKDELQNLIALKNETRKMLSATITSLARSEESHQVGESPIPYPLFPSKELEDSEKEDDPL
jgi:four helix bundle protein